MSKVFAFSRELLRSIRLSMAYAAAEAAESSTLIAGDGGHRFFADDAWPVVHQYME